MNSTRHTENLHILLWLLKDICWIKGWQIAGTLVFFPTIILAIYIYLKTIKHPLSSWVNLSVLAWISANSCWMFSEFYEWNLEWLSTSFFISGIVFIGVYLYKLNDRKKAKS
ncbi:MAG: hypothetical protein MH472_11720 [Bacteroidia bacterium]|nr:hypothetical protein [Bacteroidia bacterium]